MSFKYNYLLNSLDLIKMPTIKESASGPNSSCSYSIGINKLWVR